MRVVPDDGGSIKTRRRWREGRRFNVVVAWEVRLGCEGVMARSAASQGGAEGLMASFCGGEMPL